MACDEYIELISAAVDGALSPAEQAKLDAHLARCPGCRALLADLTAIHEGLSALPDGSPPAGLHDRIMSAVAADNVVPFAPKKKARPWKKWGALAAAVALIFAGAWGVRDSILPGADKSAEAAPRAAAPAGAESAQDDGSIFSAAGDPESVAEPAETGLPALRSAPAGGDNGLASQSGTDGTDGDAAGYSVTTTQDLSSAGNETGAYTDKKNTVYGSDGLASGQSLDEAPEEASASAAPRIAMFSAVPSSSAAPQLYVPYDAAGELGQSGEVLSQADAVTVLANYMYEFVDQVELVDDGLNVNFAVNSPTGASGVVTCVDEDPEVFFLNYQDSEDTGVYRYTVAKSDGSVNYLGCEEPETED